MKEENMGGSNSSVSGNHDVRCLLLEETECRREEVWRDSKVEAR